jgi:hypothetical protein
MQTFKDYLLSNKNLLIIWFVIHAFALFVNFFGIEGEIGEKFYSENKPSQRWEHYKYTNILTTSSEYKQNSFWPFISYYKSFSQYWGDEKKEDGKDIIENRVVTQYKYIDIYRYTHFFYGVFYQYDFSEFLAYSVLIFLYLYFSFEHKLKKSAASSIR